MAETSFFKQQTKLNNMKTTVDIYDFRKAFQDIRPNNFTYEGLEVLFDHLEMYEEDSGQEIELDVIAICCDYTEDNISEILENYNMESITELEDNTIVIPIDEERVIYIPF